MRVEGRQWEKRGRDSEKRCREQNERRVRGKWRQSERREKRGR